VFAIVQPSGRCSFGKKESTIQQAFLPTQQRQAYMKTLVDMKKIVVSTDSIVNRTTNN